MMVRPGFQAKTANRSPDNAGGWYISQAKCDKIKLVRDVYAIFPDADSHLKRDACGSGGDFQPTAAAGRDDPQGGLGHLQLPASGPAGTRQGGAPRPGGDGPGRGPGGLAARGAAGGALAGVRPLGGV